VVGRGEREREYKLQPYCQPFFADVHMSFQFYNRDENRVRPRMVCWWVPAKQIVGGREGEGGVEGRRGREEGNKRCVFRGEK
jgi:hypothetical protein